MPNRIDRLSVWGTPYWAGQSARDTGISRWERCDGRCSRPCAGRPSRQHGVGLVLAVAAADPAIVALLQELLASQQAIAARPTNVENNQARPQLQAAPTGAAGTPASAGSPPAGRRQRPQCGIRDERRNTAGYSHRKRKGKR